MDSPHFSRATRGTIGRLWAQTFRDSCLLIRAAEGATSLHAPAKRFQLMLVVGSIDALEQIRWHNDRPRREQRPLFCRAMRASPQARPPPFLRTQREIAAKRVALNLSGHNPEMLVALHRERLVSILVDMGQSCIAPVLLPSPHMDDCQPLHEGGQLAVALRTQPQLPVVRHHRVRTNPHR
jgi:hypothetical protein